MLSRRSLLSFYLLCLLHVGVYVGVLGVSVYASSHSIPSIYLSLVDILCFHCLQSFSVSSFSLCMWMHVCVCGCMCVDAGGCGCMWVCFSSFCLLFIILSSRSLSASARHRFSSVYVAFFSQCMFTDGVRGCMWVYAGVCGVCVCMCVCFSPFSLLVLFPCVYARKSLSSFSHHFMRSHCPCLCGCIRVYVCLSSFSRHCLIYFSLFRSITFSLFVLVIVARQSPPSLSVHFVCLVCVCVCVCVLLVMLVIRSYPVILSQNYVQTPEIPYRTYHSSFVVKVSSFEHLLNFGNERTNAHLLLI